MLKNESYYKKRLKHEERRKKQKETTERLLEESDNFDFIPRRTLNINSKDSDSKKSRTNSKEKDNLLKSWDLKISQEPKSGIITIEKEDIFDSKISKKKAQKSKRKKSSSMSSVIIEEEALILEKVKEKQKKINIEEKLKLFYQTDGYKTNILQTPELSNNKKIKKGKKVDLSTSYGKRAYLSLINYMDKVEEKNTENYKKSREERNENFKILKKKFLLNSCEKNIVQGNLQNMKNEIKKVNRVLKNSLSKMRRYSKKGEEKKFLDTPSSKNINEIGSGLENIEVGENEKKVKRKVIFTNKKELFKKKQQKKSNDFGGFKVRRDSLRSSRSQRNSENFKASGRKIEKILIKNRTKEENPKNKVKLAFPKKDYIFNYQENFKRKNTSDYKMRNQAIFKVTNLMKNSKKKSENKVEKNIKKDFLQNGFFLLKSNDENSLQNEDKNMILRNSLGGMSYTSYRYSSRYKKNRENLKGIFEGRKRSNIPKPDFSVKSRPGSCRVSVRRGGIERGRKMGEYGFGILL